MGRNKSFQRGSISSWGESVEVDHPRLKNQLRIHWNWIRREDDYEEVYRILEAFLRQEGNLNQEREDNIVILWISGVLLAIFVSIIIYGILKAVVI